MEWRHSLRGVWVAEMADAAVLDDARSNHRLVEKRERNTG